MYTTFEYDENGQTEDISVYWFGKDPNGGILAYQSDSFGVSYTSSGITVAWNQETAQLDAIVYLPGVLEQKLEDLYTQLQFVPDEQITLYPVDENTLTFLSQTMEYSDLYLVSTANKALLAYQSSVKSGEQWKVAEEISAQQNQPSPVTELLLTPFTQAKRTVTVVDQGEGKTYTFDAPATLTTRLYSQEGECTLFADEECTRVLDGIPAGENVTVYTSNEQDTAE